MYVNCMIYKTDKKSEFNQSLLGIRTLDFSAEKNNIGRHISFEKIAEVVL